MINLLKRIGGALKDAVVQMFGLQVVFRPRRREVKNAAIMDFPENAIGELALWKDIMSSRNASKTPREFWKRVPFCRGTADLLYLTSTSRMQPFTRSSCCGCRQ